MTIVVNAKEKQCFYEKVEANHVIDIEYQVREHKSALGMIGCRFKGSFKCV
jgi:hypothetical protein